MSSPVTTRRTVIRSVSVVLLVLAVLYGLRVAWLFVMADEGDMPPSSSVALPSGAVIVSEERVCGSGGCSAILRVEPPDGQSADDLAATIGATPELRIPGNFFDPRTISVLSRVDGRMLELNLSYSSTEYVP